MGVRDDHAQPQREQRVGLLRDGLRTIVVTEQAERPEFPLGQDVDVVGRYELPDARRHDLCDLT
jgi:hypothetical protein